MEIKNCPRCGEVFIASGRDVCPRCIKKEEEEYELVRAYVTEHSGSSIEEVSEATGVGSETVLGFLRDGRLVDGRIRDVNLRCGVCGAPIESGRACKACMESFNKVTRDLDPKTGGTDYDRFHTFERIKKTK